jgi:DNA replication protein DnaC
VGAWITNPTDGLLFSGGTGSGKTHLAAAIVREVVIGGGDIKFRRAADLYQAIRGSFHNQDNSEVSILKDYLGPGILILDDLGAGTLSDFERRYTLEVFDCRLSARKPTIVTTNWSLSEIANKLDDRIASRLSGFMLLEFRGTDKRGSKTQRPSKLKQS